MGLFEVAIIRTALGADSSLPMKGLSKNVSHQAPTIQSPLHNSTRFLTNLMTCWLLQVFHYIDNEWVVTICQGFRAGLHLLPVLMKCVVPRPGQASGLWVTLPHSLTHL